MPTRMTGLILVAVTLLAGGSRAQEASPLTAFALEHLDEETDAIGARALLEKAGFAVEPLPLGRSPAQAKADLIVIGSFASELPDYAVFMKKHGRSLASWVRKGGVLLQMTQSSGTEEAPPFLADGLEAYRGGQEFKTLRVLAPDHPLLAELPIEGEGEKRLPLAPHLGHPPNRQSLFWQMGFAVLIASDPAGRYPALMEGALGDGRVILSSLFLDKVLDEKTRQVAERPFKAVADQFFANLAAYVRRVKSGEGPAVTPSVHPDLPSAEEEPSIGEPVAVAWNLAASDFAHYERRTVVKKGRRDLLVNGEIATVYGHDLRDGAQYFPVSPRLEDLPAILAFRLPPAGKATDRVDDAIPIPAVAALRLKGKIDSREFGPDAALVTAEYKLTSRGKAAKTDTHLIQKGVVKVRAVFDRKEGVFVRARVEITYLLGRVNSKAGGKPKEVGGDYDFRRLDLKRTRYEGFEQDVAAAIERGVAYLRTLRRESGTYKPHGNWIFGTTALAVFTLVSCDVPHDDPYVERSLLWMCQQEPERTYDLALGLMALDRAYAPLWEILRERRGEPVPYTRKLPPERQAWCEKTAATLLKIARSPGVWSYSGESNRLTLQFDASNTQYAVLGLRAAARLGIEVKERNWLGVIQYFGQLRERDGPRGTVRLALEGRRPKKGESVAETPVRQVAGYRYATIQDYPKPYGSMTCAAIASLAIAREQLSRQRGGPLPPKQEKEIEDLMLSGWAWLDRHWGMDRHPEEPKHSWFYYYLYNLERATVLNRVRLVGGKDWYYEGAVQLLARQAEDGSWNAPGTGNIPETCFALLFLKRATAPSSPSRK